MLWIDDLQWGDLDSALLLTELFQGPQPPRILLLASYRSEYEGANPCLKAFSESGRFNRGGARVERLEVGPLDPSAAERLVEILLRDFGVYEAGHAASIVRESARNPYLIGEIVRHTQASTKSPEGVSTSTGGVSLQEMVWSRIQRLPEEPRRLLEVVAVAGQPLSQKCAYLAGGLDVKDQASLRLLRNERLLRSAGPGIDDDLEVYHDQIGETLRRATRCGYAAASTTDGSRSSWRVAAERIPRLLPFISHTAISLRERGVTFTRLRFRRFGRWPSIGQPTCFARRSRSEPGRFPLKAGSRASWETRWRIRGAGVKRDISTWRRRRGFRSGNRSIFGVVDFSSF